MAQRLAFDLAGELAGDSGLLQRRPGSHSGALMNSPEDLIDRARTGDQEAFRLIFERYARPLLSFVYDMVGQRDLAEELTQETFVRAFRSIDQIRDHTKFPSWLFGIGKNVAREAIRAKQRLRVNLDLSQCEIVDSERKNPAQDLQQKELNGAMHHALQALDDDRRMILVLKVFHQRSYQEIAEITGFSLAKVKTELHRARLEVRRKLRPLV